MSDKTAPYQYGEIVEIIIRKAKVHDSGDGFLYVDIPGNDLITRLPLGDGKTGDGGVRVLVLQPADGPALPGDIWRTPAGARWFAYEEMQYGKVALFLTSGELRGHTLAEICESFGTPTLEYRAPAPSGPEACDCLAPFVPEPVADPLAVASQQLRETTDGDSFASAFGGFMTELGKAAEHEQGFHDDCDPARCADAERAVAELHGEPAAVKADWRDIRGSEWAAREGEALERVSGGDALVLSFAEVNAVYGPLVPA